MRSVVALALVAALVSAGCGDDPAPTGSPSPTSTGTTTTPAPSETVADVPGEPFGLAVAGATYHVVGVAHDDTLNVRSGPGTDFDIVAELEPTGTATATGEDRLLDSGLWIELSAAGVTGWADYSFLAHAGGTFDVTADVIAANGGDTPEGEDLASLGRRVADLRASTDPASRIRVVVAPTEGDLGEVTLDVVGLGDDSIKGERLHVFAEATDAGWVLHSVEMTLLCDRGADGDLCV